MAVKFIKRADVEDRLVEKWLEAINLANEVRLPYRLPRWSTLRNYEMEQMMQDHFGDNWIVVEWCPFNGIFCRYQKVASRYDLKKARNNIAAVQDSTFDKKYLFGLIDGELAKRPDELGEKQYWGAGWSEG